MSILPRDIGNVIPKGANSLLRRVVDKVNALLDIALEVLVAGLEELLLLLVRFADNIDSLLGAVRL
jgi:hypothetical protein